MDLLIYFGVLSLNAYIAEIVGLTTGLLLLIYFSVSLYKFFNDII